MKRLALLLLAIFAASPLGATAQAPDILKVDGKTYSLHSNPLSAVLAEHEDRLPKPEVVSSGLWRGYIATWSVRDGRLWLDNVEMPTRDYATYNAPESKKFRSVTKELFQDDGASRVATWFTGHLIVPTGKIVNYVHMGYGSTYSEYLVLKIVKGEVKQQRKMGTADFETFRRAQYEAYRKTPDYAKERAELKDMDEKLKEDFLYQFLSEEYLSRIFEP